MAAGDPVGQWHGKYSCIQGESTLDLDVERMSSERVTATFRFGPTSSNPDDPKGCYVMTGRYDRRTDFPDLDPNGWLSRTPGFEMVGHREHLQDGARSIRGTISGGTACTTFDVERSPDTSADAAPCRMPSWQ